MKWMKNILAGAVIGVANIIPVSYTHLAISSSFFKRKMVSGRPMLLLKFPCVFSVRYFCDRTEASISFVEVFPTLPAVSYTHLCE